MLRFGMVEYQEGAKTQAWDNYPWTMVTGKLSISINLLRKKTTSFKDRLNPH
jgi:hypothetical protein